MVSFDLTGDQLIEQAVKGDRDAFSSLYCAYAEKIFRHVFNWVPDEADAEDITQETFIRAWLAVRRYRKGQTPFLSWLMVIARHLVADFYRLKRNHSLLDDTPSLSLDTDIEREVETNLTREELFAAIYMLKTSKQKVLIMRFIDDMSYHEMGRILGKSEGAIRVLVHRALLDLKKTLTSREVGRIVF